MEFSHSLAPELRSARLNPCPSSRDSFADSPGLRLDTPITEREASAFDIRTEVAGVGNAPYLAGAPSPFYSNLRDSTGSNCAARVAGRVPNTTPTSVAAASAMTADSPEMGMRYEVKSLTE